MSESRRFPTHLEDFVLWQERKIQEEQEEEHTNVLVRKVTLRISLGAFMALRMLARRYGVSVTALGEKLLESAAYDAADIAGIDGEAIGAEVAVECEFLNQAAESSERRDLLAALDEHDMSLAPTAMEAR